MRALASPSDRGAGIALAVLVLLLPFEPRAALKADGLSFTALEAAAVLAAGVLAWAGRHRLLPLLRRPPLPLAALAAYALAHMLSAVLAPEQGARAARFALRMAAMAAFGVLVAAAPAAARRKGLAALVASALVVAALAIGEGIGVRPLDAVLQAFREAPFNVAGLRRASAGSEYPNLAAAFLMCGLLASAGLLSDRPRPSALAVLSSLVLVGGLLFTYSRGALVAAGIGLLLPAGLLRWRCGRWPATPLAALAVLVAGSFAFASTQEVFRLRLGRVGADEWYRATYEPFERSLALRPGETRRTRVRVTNAGPKTWTREEAFHLSYHWFSREWPAIRDGSRTELPRDLGQGESVVLEAQITAPSREGRYILVWDMVHEHAAWFSGQGVRPAVVPVGVGEAFARAPEGAPDARLAEATLAWRASRAELWRLAAGMWAERPWAGFGSDSFRWSYGPRAGHPYWDDRIFANNTLLEAAATTGTLGAASLLLALLSSAVAAGSSLDSGPKDAPVAAALFGLVAGLFAHGVVDYVLAFTGHYLLFGFVVGSCAALQGEAR